MEKNLGHATAYGYAKSKGYSGTEEEFAQLMADYASVGQSAAQSAEQAAASATSASGSAATAASAAQTATGKASEAVTAADTATTKASEASTSAGTASTAAQTATDKASEATTAATTATTKASEASESATTATTAKTDAESARDAAAQSASEAAESARTLTIDATLTQSGQAADAKAVGDEIDSLKSAIDKFDITPVLTSSDVVEDYYVNGSNGMLVSSTNYVCTDFVDIPAESEGLNLTTNCFFGSIIGYAFYSTKNLNSFISGGTGSGFAQKTITTIIPQNARYFRTTLKKTDYTSPSDFGISYQYSDLAVKKTVDGIVTNVNEINASLVSAETDIEKNIDALQLIPTWTNGTIQSSGAIDSRTDRINTGLMKANVESVKCINDYYGLIAYYNIDRGFISLTSFAKNFTIDKSSFPAGTFYIAVAMHNGTSSISPSEGTNCIILYSVDDVAKGTFDITGEVAPFNEGSKNQIARLGWDVYNSKNPPEQTNQSYALAYKNGCRIMLADVRVTSDGKFVMWHDEALNNNVRHTDGTALSNAEKAMTIAGSTLSELNVFDYGIYRGAEYAGMKIPMLEDFVKWCSLANCIPMLEIKVQLTEANCVAIANMCKQYGLGDRVIIDEYYSYLQNTVDYWKANLHKCTLCIIAWNNVSTAQSFINSKLLNTDIRVLLTISGTDQLSLISTNGNIDYDKVKTVTNVGAKLTYTEVNSSSAMNALYESGYIFVFSYIASGYINVNEWLRDKLGIK